MANLNRGEYELTVNDTSYTLVLSLADLEAVEEQLSVGVSELLTQLARGTARIKDINAVVRRGLLAVRPKLQKQEIEIVLKEADFQSRYTAALRLLAGCMNMLEEQRDEKAEEDEGEPEVKQERPLSLQTENSTGDS